MQEYIPLGSVGNETEKKSIFSSGIPAEGGGLTRDCEIIYIHDLLRLKTGLAELEIFKI